MVPPDTRHPVTTSIAHRSNMKNDLFMDKASKTYGGFVRESKTGVSPRQGSPRYNGSTPMAQQLS